MYKVGSIYTSRRPADGQTVYHEILAIGREWILFNNFGEDVEGVEYYISKRELLFRIREGMLVEVRENCDFQPMKL